MTRFLISLLAVFLAACASTSAPKNVSDAPGREYYQLKTYTFSSTYQLELTETYLAKALLPALERLGIGPVGVFKPRPSSQDSTLRVYLLIPFTSLAEFDAYEERLTQDSAYLAAGAEYLLAIPDFPPYQRISSVLMKAFEDMPNMSTPALTGPRADRIYELRSYESSTEVKYRNKVDMFNVGGEIKIFDQLGFNAVFYGEVISGERMPNLMYMTTHEDQSARDANWKAFSDSPEWGYLKGNVDFQNNVSHIDIFFLYPTDYSAY